jgi:polar amino acid transport system ATP-binding protein
MIRVAKLVKSFASAGRPGPAREVLRGITLEVAPGDVAVVIGPSGSGKSTFLRCLNGLERFDSGTVEVDGTVLEPGLTALEEEARLCRIRSRVGMVFQQFHLFPHLTVLGNITEAPLRVARLPPRQAEEKARALLERVGLASMATRRPAQLSGGEQQRVAIARALAMEPEVILFDEPTSSLDPRMTAEVLAVVEDLAAGGQTMVIVTHAMSFARRAATRVHVFDGGRLVESGPPAAIFDSPREDATRELLRQERYA